MGINLLSSLLCELMLQLLQLKEGMTVDVLESGMATLTIQCFRFSTHEIVCVICTSGPLLKGPSHANALILLPYLHKFLNVLWELSRF